jgi:hypothetical protein
MIATATYFRFEEDFVEEGIRCIPMIVRYKLDRCGIKLKLSEWSRMNELEREHLAEHPCGSQREITAYRSWLQIAVYQRTGDHATNLPVDITPSWNSDYIPAVIHEKLQESGLRLTDAQWRSLTDLQKFALVKLSRPGHENRNFPIALKEFIR